ncbi:MAG: hypothetical protein M3297_04015 [Thermoproteota archaeon]|nr:hypothetical protein [Thermoproteota archaeon]
MTAIAQTSMIAACLAILVYIAVVTTGSYLANQANEAEQNSLSQQQQMDDALHKLVSTNFNYSHTADTNRASQTVLLNGLNLNTSEFVLLYDSTPYASKGHIALNLPCDSNSPNNPLFQVLVGRAPDLVPTTLGYIGQISEPPQMCIYHAQFGFGKPVTDVTLKNISDRSINLTGPHSVAITTHESFIPTDQSFMEAQH